MSVFGEPTSLNWGVPEQSRRRLWPLVGIGVAAVAVGGAVVAGAVYWQGQNDRMDRMVAALTELRGTAASVAPAPGAALLPVSPASAVAVAAAIPASGASGTGSAAPVADGSAGLATRDAPQGILAVTDTAARDAAEAAAADAALAGIATITDAVLPDLAETRTLVPVAAPSEVSVADQIRSLAALDIEEGAELSAAPDAAPDATATPVSAAAGDLAAIARTVGAEQPDAAPSASDRLRYIAALEAMEDADTSGLSMARDEARLAVLGEALNGVREIARRAANGQYEIQRKKRPGADMQPHFVVRGYEREQAALIDLLGAAAQNDIITYPAFVVNENGTIDAEALLLSAVQEAMASGAPDAQWAGERLANTIAAVRAAETTIVRGERVYTVEAGDSLAFIALQFYGNVNSYSRIFEANRDVIDSPERIRVGQRLRIPL